MAALLSGDAGQFVGDLDKNAEARARWFIAIDYADEAGAPQRLVFIAYSMRGPYIARSKLYAATPVSYTHLLLVMTLFLGVEGPVARCINLLYFLPTALGCLYYHKKNGYLKKEAIRSAILPGVALAVAGAVAAAFVDTQLLRKAFGLYLLWAGVSVLWPKKKK